MVKGTRLQIPVMTVSGAGVKNDSVRLMILPVGGCTAAGCTPQARRTADPDGPDRLADGDTARLQHPGRGRTLGPAVMPDIGPALRAAGNRVLYVAALAAAKDLDRGRSWRPPPTKSSGVRARSLPSAPTGPRTSAWSPPTW